MASGSTIDSTGTWILRSSSLRTPVSTIRQCARARPGTGRPPQRVLGGRQADPLHVAPGGLREPLERQRQVRAALGRRDRVDLVDDAPVRAGEQLLRAAGEHQVQRLGRGDQDVGRLAEHRLALALRRVAGPHRDRQLRADTAQRRPEVAVDVVGQRLQRGHVDEADPPLVGPRLAGRPAGRSPTGTRRASCPTRSGPRSGRARRRRSPARPGPAPALGLRRRPGTSRGCVGLNCSSAMTTSRP